MKIFGRSIVRRVRTMFIDQRADSKWRINIEGNALEPGGPKKSTKILQGRKRWVCMVMSCSRWEDPWTWDKDKGLLAWPAESGRGDEEEEGDEERYWRSMTPTERQISFRDREALLWEIKWLWDM